MSKEKTLLSFEKSQTGKCTVDTVTQPKYFGCDETTWLYATSLATDEFAEALSGFADEIGNARKTDRDEVIMSAKEITAAEERFMRRCLWIAQKAMGTKTPEKEYLCIEKYEVRGGANQVTVDLEDDDIIFKAGEGLYHASGSFVDHAHRPPKKYERYKFDPAVKIYLANYIGFKITLANSISTSYDESLPLKKEINEPTAIIIPGIFEVTEADRIEPGTEIARMRLYKKDV